MTTPLGPPIKNHDIWPTTAGKQGHTPGAIYCKCHPEVTTKPSTDPETPEIVIRTIRHKPLNFGRRI